MEEEGGSQSLAELLEKEAELISKLSALSLELSATTEELKEVDLNQQKMSKYF